MTSSSELLRCKSASMFEESGMLEERGMLEELGMLEESGMFEESGVIWGGVGGTIGSSLEFLMDSTRGVGSGGGGGIMPMPPSSRKSDGVGVNPRATSASKEYESNVKKFICIYKTFAKKNLQCPWLQKHETKRRRKSI